MKNNQDSSNPTSGKRITLDLLKELVIARLPPGSPLREVILMEADSLTPQEFLAKVDVWLKLLRRDKTRD